MIKIKGNKSNSANIYLGIQLIDSKSRTVVMSFIFPTKMIKTNTLSWVDSAPGMFLTGGYYLCVMYPYILSLLIFFI